LEQPQIESLPGYGREIEEAMSAFAETGGSLAHRVAHSPGNFHLNKPSFQLLRLRRRCGVSHHRLEDFLDEEGVTVGSLVQPIQEVSSYTSLKTEDRPDHDIDLGSCQRRQVNLRCQPLAFDASEEVLKAWLDLLGAVSQQEEDGTGARVGQLAGEVCKKLLRSFIAPVQVFYNDEQGPARGQANEDLRQGMEYSPLLLIWIDDR
jgi:hypothetical protein